MKQTTSHILMIKPARFSFNAETAVNNSFQQASEDGHVAEKAAKEFDFFVDELVRHGISVTVVQDSDYPETPDSIFPNNWISTHHDGTVFLYPMFAANRRLERKPAVLEAVRERFSVTQVNDLSSFEEQEKFLEGTGSMVLDRQQRIAYACISPRTDSEVLKDFCNKAGYRSLMFHAEDKDHKAIYHTNVMMAIADKYAVVCLDSIPDPQEREELVKSLERSEHEIIPISFDQLYAFAGNMLQVNNDTGERYLVMSSRAYNSLTEDQRTRIENYNPIISVPLNSIEDHGGGSARCMMAEIFLPLKS